ncbi:MAG: T9SS type A sorting domain-containing protein [Ginsengibacter sp.]
MKNFTLLVAFCLTIVSGFAQRCPNYVDVLFYPVAGKSTFVVVADVDQQSNFKYFVYCNGVLINQGCRDISSIADQVGIASAAVARCNGIYTYKLVFSDGVCGSGNPPCDTVSAPQGNPLPVVLGNFGVQRKPAAVELRWETEQEINSGRFEIQRSIGLKGFQSIGTIDAKGNTSSLNTYSFNDKTNVSSSVSFYRIKMIDLDGTYSYTSIKSVKGSGIASDFKVFPNPTTSAATVSINDLSEPVTISVMDHSGRLVKKVSLTNSNQVHLNNLQKGNYIIKMTGEESGETIVRQLSVLK